MVAGGGAFSGGSLEVVVRGWTVARVVAGGKGVYFNSMAKIAGSVGWQEVQRWWSRLGVAGNIS